ncbi:MAG: hypothetical protein FJ109_03340 [Deltaproteobacteria bacterium]|nr:hypothetical protein [Deltaproteobacteria bacterium]
MRSLPALLLAVLLASACTTTFRQLETSYAPHDFSRPVQVYPRLAGEACEWRLFGLIAVSGDNSATEAMSKLTRSSAKIDNLLSVQVMENNVNYLVVSKSCTHVSAYPVVYKDTLPKWEPFEGNMMSGRLVKKPEVSPGGGAVPTPVSPPPPGKTGPTVKRDEPPIPPPPTKSTVPTQSQCESKCASFATLWKGSDAIRGTIRGQCVKKCLQPENEEYRKCIEGASKIDDIGKCNNM